MGLRRMSHETQSLSHIYLPSMNTLLQADRDLYQAVTAQWLALAVEPGSAEFRAAVADKDENIEQAVQRIKKFSEVMKITSEMSEKLTSFNRLISAWKQASKELSELATVQQGLIGRFKI
jgi:methyl-accepting chemotaxis protein